MNIPKVSSLYRKTKILSHATDRVKGDKVVNKVRGAFHPFFCTDVSHYKNRIAKNE